MKKEILFPMSNGSSILLTDIVETFGHDDSLPFNAILSFSPDGCGNFSKLAKVWNDGWGGMTNIDAVGMKERKICNDLDKFIKETYEIRFRYNGKEQTLSESLESMVNNMASLAIDNNINHLKPSVMKQLNIFEKKKELNVGDIVCDPKEIVKAPGVWEEYERGKDTPVAKRVVTERKDIIDAKTGADVTVEICSLEKRIVERYQWKLVYKF